MDKKDMKNIVKAGVKFMALTGTAKFMRNIMPYEGVFGTAACLTATFFVGLAMNDVVDAQMLKCEKILEGLSNGDQMVIW